MSGLQNISIAMLSPPYFFNISHSRCWPLDTMAQDKWWPVFNCQQVPQNVTGALILAQPHWLSTTRTYLIGRDGSCDTPWRAPLWIAHIVPLWCGGGYRILNNQMVRCNIFYYPPSSNTPAGQSDQGHSGGDRGVRGEDSGVLVWQIIYTHPIWCYTQTGQTWVQILF